MTRFACHTLQRAHIHKALATAENAQYREKLQGFCSLILIMQHGHFPRPTSWIGISSSWVQILCDEFYRGVTGLLLTQLLDTRQTFGCLGTFLPCPYLNPAHSIFQLQGSTSTNEAACWQWTLWPLSVHRTYCSQGHLAWVVDRKDTASEEILRNSYPHINGGHGHPKRKFKFSEPTAHVAGADTICRHIIDTKQKVLASTNYYSSDFLFFGRFKIQLKRHHCSLPW